MDRKKSSIKKKRFIKQRKNEKIRDIDMNNEN